MRIEIAHGMRSRHAAVIDGARDRARDYAETLNTTIQKKRQNGASEDPKFGTPGAVPDTSSEVDAGGFTLGTVLSSLRERAHRWDSKASGLR